MQLRWRFRIVYTLVDIWLYSKNYESGEIVPIFMEIAEVV